MTSNDRSLGRNHSGLGAWLRSNCLQLVECIGIIASLLITGYTLHISSQTTRINNLLLITQYHRELWSTLFTKPELQRVLDPSPDLAANGITEDERLFTLLLILHLSASFEASRAGELIPLDGLRNDMKDFFRLPIPRAVWERQRPYQNNAFVAFVESTIDPAILQARDP